MKKQILALVEIDEDGQDSVIVRTYPQQQTTEEELEFLFDYLENTMPAHQTAYENTLLLGSVLEEIINDLQAVKPSANMTEVVEALVLLLLREKYEVCFDWLKDKIKEFKVNGPVESVVKTVLESVLKHVVPYFYKRLVLTRPDASSEVRQQSNELSQKWPYYENRFSEYAKTNWLLIREAGLADNIQNMWDISVDATNIQEPQTEAA